MNKIILCATLLLVQLSVAAQKSNSGASDKNSKSSPLVPESSQWWYQQGQKAIKELSKVQIYPKQAKNVILFVGDGMSVSTVFTLLLLPSILRLGEDRHAAPVSVAPPLVSEARVS